MADEIHGLFIAFFEPEPRIVYFENPCPVHPNEPTLVQVMGRAFDAMTDFEIIKPQLVQHGWLEKDDPAIEHDRIVAAASLFIRHSPN
jgi:hypothetical protein